MKDNKKQNRSNMSMEDKVVSEYNKKVDELNSKQSKKEAKRESRINSVVDKHNQKILKLRSKKLKSSLKGKQTVEDLNLNYEKKLISAQYKDNKELNKRKVTDAKSNKKSESANLKAKIESQKAEFSTDYINSVHQDVYHLDKLEKENKQNWNARTGSNLDVDSYKKEIDLENKANEEYLSNTASYYVIPKTNQENNSFTSDNSLNNDSYNKIKEENEPETTKEKLFDIDETKEINNSSSSYFLDDDKDANNNFKDEEPKEKILSEYERFLASRTGSSTNNLNEKKESENFADPIIRKEDNTSKKMQKDILDDLKVDEKNVEIEKFEIDESNLSKKQLLKKLKKESKKIADDELTKLDIDLVVANDDSKHTKHSEIKNKNDDEYIEKDYVKDYLHDIENEALRTSEIAIIKANDLIKEK